MTIRSHAAVALLSAILFASCHGSPIAVTPAPERAAAPPPPIRQNASPDAAPTAPARIVETSDLNGDGVAERMVAASDCGAPGSACLRVESSAGGVWREVVAARSARCLVPLDGKTFEDRSQTVWRHLLVIRDPADGAGRLATDVLVYDADAHAYVDMPRPEPFALDEPAILAPAGQQEQRLVPAISADGRHVAAFRGHQTSTSCVGQSAVVVFRLAPIAQEKAIVFSDHGPDCEDTGERLAPKVRAARIAEIRSLLRRGAYRDLPALEPLVVGVNNYVPLMRNDSWLIEQAEDGMVAIREIGCGALPIVRDRGVFSVDGGWWDAATGVFVLSEVYRHGPDGSEEGPEPHVIALPPGVSAGASVRSRATLELRIASQFASLQNAHFDLTLRNTSKRPLWVNTRMALVSSAPPGLNEVWLDIVGPSGPVNFACRADRALARDQNYAVLAPNATVTTSRELHCFVDIKAGATYLARAHYHDRNEKVPPAPAGSDHLSEEIVSAWTRFEVKAK